MILKFICSNPYCRTSWVSSGGKIHERCPTCDGGFGHTCETLYERNGRDAAFIMDDET